MCAEHRHDDHERYRQARDAAARGLHAMTVEGPLTASRLDNYIAALSIVSERLDVVVADETIHAFLVMALDGEMQSAQHIVVEPG